MYGSSLRIETCRPRLLSSRPIDAAVMPLPSEEVTPPVTKTYFAIERYSAAGWCVAGARGTRAGSPGSTREAILAHRARAGAVLGEARRLASAERREER